MFPNSARISSVLKMVKPHLGYCVQLGLSVEKNMDIMNRVE